MRPGKAYSVWTIVNLEIYEVREVAYFQSFDFHFISLAIKLLLSFNQTYYLITNLTK